MSESQNLYVELPRIKRKINSWEGKVIDYLLKHPSNKAATELSIEAITCFWLAEALEGGVSQPELTKACWSAIEKLEGKLATIRRVAGIEKLPTSYITPLATGTTNVTAASTDENQQANSDESDSHWEDDLMNLQFTEEMKQVNRLFSVD